MHTSTAPVETRPRDPFQWVGETIGGNYAIEALAGEGGYGIVYRATHLTLEVPVAVKCLKLPPYLDERARNAFLGRLRAEARILHRLSRRHAGIAQALDMGTAISPSGLFTPFLVMEWLDGDTLDAFLSQRRRTDQRPLGLEGALDLLSPVAEALTIAHEENVSHLDIKPSNLIFTRAGAGQTMKVLDFGVAAAFLHTQTSADARSGKTAFSPAYGAPEQFDAERGTPGRATDVFAMALVAIELATGRRVLEGYDIIQLSLASLGAAARVRMAGVHPRVEAILRKSLEPRMEHRFATMGEMWLALLSAQRGAGQRNVRSSVTNVQVVAGETVEGERRVCTILTLDLDCVLTQQTGVDAEKLKEFLDRTLRTVAKIVDEFGGVVEPSTGERIIAAFGIPNASDNDAERAVAAALRIGVLLANPSSNRPRAMGAAALRIGIGTGRAFVERSSQGEGVVFRVVGDALRIARQMEQLVPEGGVVIAPETHRRLLGLFHVAPLFAASTNTALETPDGYRVLGSVPLRVPVTACEFRGVPTRLVGRDAERQRLLDTLETVVSEKLARRVTLVGPTGIGRSRMLAEFVSEVVRRQEPWLVFLGQTSPLAQSTSYGLVASMLRGRFGIREGDSAVRVRRRIAGALRWLRMRPMGPRDEDTLLGRETTAVFTDAEGWLDDLEIVLGLRQPRAPIAGLTPADDAARAEKTRIVVSMVRLCRFITRRLPVIVVCDDLQWADDGSLDLFEALAAVDDVPLFLVGSARPELFDRRPTMRDDTTGTHAIVQLGPLPRRHLEEIVRDRLHRVVELPDELVGQLVLRAEGNPLLLEETLHWLLDAGAVEVMGTDTWSVKENFREALSLPPTVQGIVHARLDRLGEESRTLLSRAAVVGRTFWQGLAEHLIEGEYNALDVGRIVGELRRKQIVKQREPSSVAGEREFQFAEATTHEVAYDVLPARVRRGLHLRVAQWFQSRGAGLDGAGILAHHYDRGGDVVRALAAYQRAAAHSAALGEHAAAATLLGRASELLRTPTTDDDGPWTGDERRVATCSERVGLELNLSAALRRLGRYEEALLACERARELIDTEHLRENGDGEFGERNRWYVRIDYHVALVCRVQGRVEEAMGALQRAIALALDGDMLEEIPPMHALLSFLHRRQGRPDEAIRTARRGLRICRALRDDLPRRGEWIAHLLLGAAVGYYSQRRWFASERCYRTAARAVSEAVHPHLAGVAWNGVSGALLGRGEVAAARDALARSLRLKERAGDVHQVLVAHSNMAEIELRLGRPQQAFDHAKRAVERGEKTGVRSDLADMYKNLAAASQALGNVEMALTAGRRAVELAAASGRVYLNDAIATLEGALLKAEALDQEKLHPFMKEARAVLVGIQK